MKFQPLLVILLLAVLIGPAWSAPLKGKATIDSEPVGGISISAYPVESLDFSKPAPHRIGPTGENGLFEMDLPQGEYYLLARGPNLFAYYGRNPVSVPKEGLEKVNLLMVPDNLAGPEGPVEIETGIAGMVTDAGKPVPGAVVTVYPDLSSQLKGFGLGMSNPTDENGRFEMPLPAGNYYLVVRVRQSGMFAGPLRAGDKFGYLPANPVVVNEGQIARVQIPLIEVPEKVERYAASLFGSTRISGRILDADGKPVAGLRALLYDDSTMLNRPLYVSQPSDAEGRYVISFPKGGRYYLAARDQLGGTPGPGELYGRYQGTPDHSVRVRTGKHLEEIDLTVDEVY